MTSLRTVCAALGAHGHVSLCRDVLGFPGYAREDPYQGHREYPPEVPRGNGAPSPQIQSIRRFIALLRGPHFHIHLMLPGAATYQKEVANGTRALNFSVHRTRTIFAAAGIGVGRVTREFLSDPLTDSYATSSDFQRTGALITKDGDFVPVVAVIGKRSDHGGLSGKAPVGGPCSPRRSDDMNSVVTVMDDASYWRTLAHEIAHFLGAEHPANRIARQLMLQDDDLDRNEFLTDEQKYDSTDIIESDRAKLVMHCVIRGPLAI